MVELRAELLHADGSGRVVRVSAHQGERLLGSCLGEAPDAERAEDRAVARLRARLGLNAQALSSQASADQEGDAVVPSLTPLTPPNPGEAVPVPQKRPVMASTAAHPDGALSAAQPTATASNTDSATDTDPTAAALPGTAQIRPASQRSGPADAAQPARVAAPAPAVAPATAAAVAAAAAAAPAKAPAAGSPAGQPSPTAGGDVLTQAKSLAGASAPLRTPGTSSSPPRTASNGSSQAGPPGTDQPQAALAVTSPDQLTLTGTHEPQAGVAATNKPGAPTAGSPRSQASAAETSEPREHPDNAAAASTPEQAQPAADLEQAEPPQAPPADPDDWSQELAGLELQLRRLAWGREQEAVFLERAFGHPSRSRLTTYGDLMAYLRALEGLETGADPASAPVPLRRRDLVRVGDELLVALGWSAEQGRRFLEEHLGQSSRQRLSDTELLQFNMLLEAELIQLEPVVAESTPSQPDAQGQPT
jgi:hypothetical protein